MRAAKISSFVSLVNTALFTGLMFCFIVVIDRTLVTLSAPIYTEVMQKLIRNADNPPLVPLTVVLSVLSPIVTLIALRRHAQSLAFRYTAAAMVCILAVLFITIVLNVPINNAIMSWPTDNPPADWAEHRDRWHLLNMYRTPASALALVLHILAAYAIGRLEREEGV